MTYEHQQATSASIIQRQWVVHFSTNVNTASHKHLQKVIIPVKTLSPKLTTIICNTMDKASLSCQFYNEINR